MFNRQEKILLALVATIQFVHILDFIVLMPLGPYLNRILHINAQQFGQVVSAYSFSAGASGILAAMFIDRFDRRSALLVTFTGFAFGTLACALAPNYEFLVLARVLAGAFGGVVGSLVLSIVGDQIPAQRRGSAMGVVMASFSVASVIGVPGGLYLADLFGWHAPFFLIAGLSFLLLPLVRYALPSMRSHLQDRISRAHPLQLLPTILANGNQRRALLLMVVVIFAQFLVVPFISPYMVHNVGFAESQLKFIYLVGGILTIFSSPIVGRLADRYGHRNVFAVAATAVLPLFLILTTLPPVPLALALCVTGAFFIVSSARNIPSTALVTSAVPPATRGGFMSLNSALQQLSIGAATYVSSHVVTEGPGGVIQRYVLLGIGACLLSLLSIWIARGVQAYQPPVPPTEAAPANALVANLGPLPVSVQVPAPVPPQRDANLQAAATDTVGAEH